MAVFHSFLWLNNTPAYRCTTFRLSILRWVGVWVVPTFCQLWKKLLGVCLFPGSGVSSHSRLSPVLLLLLKHRSLLPLLPSPRPPPSFSFLFLPPVLCVGVVSPPPPSLSQGVGVCKSFPGSPGQAQGPLVLSLQGCLAAHPWEIET